MTNYKRLNSIHTVGLIGTKEWIGIVLRCTSGIQFLSSLHIVSFNLCNSLLHGSSIGVTGIILIHTTIYSHRFHLENPFLLHHPSRPFGSYLLPSSLVPGIDYFVVITLSHPQQFIRRTKEAATQAACAGNTRGYHSEYGNSWFNNRENDDAYYMFRSYNNCYYSSSEPVSDEEDEL